MRATALCLRVTIHASRRAVVRAAATLISPQARHDAARQDPAARHRF